MNPNYEEFTAATTSAGTKSRPTDCAGYGLLSVYNTFERAARTGTCPVCGTPELPTSPTGFLKAHPKPAS